ncbi:GntR family transcriptional regulator [Natronospirillum operosum]|uniref:GntR family transcriptional regulator n=1 Tax=Natronospirillum operosum TaxID=2759953 RepID=A0A4Z0W5D3_9GAMM|nr:GntR family transcriptional regulator [Natronospirillum operosum]TGG92077.1 GntR family transcriptional regulator [Natronospirillum operosum]
MSRTSNLDNQSIYDLVLEAIVRRKLPPGTKLSEERLSKVFGVSRTRLREVFLRLSQDRIITLRVNRGAYVTEPTARDTAEVFAARRAVESAVVTELADTRGNTELFKLKQHLEREAQARQAGDHQLLTQLTGDFHLLLAELSGNSIYFDIVRRLAALSSLIIYLYDSPNASACKDDEHLEIVLAIEAGDPERARDLLLAHLQHVENSLRTSETDSDDFNIEAVFAELMN